MVLTSSVAPQRALISRSLDFWMLGGASLVVWVLMMAGSGFRSHYGVGLHFQNIVATMATLGLIVNYPHHTAAYHLAYFRGWAFVRKHWLQTIAAPLIMVLLIGWTFALSYGSPSEQARSAVILAAMLNFMLLTTFWHYSKQTFGVMMVYANYDGYRLTRRQRELIRYSLLALWWNAFAWSGRFGGGVEFLGLQFQSWHKLFPWWIPPLTSLILIGLVLGVLFEVILKNWKSRRPSLNFVTPYLAIFVWIAPWLRQHEFYLYAIPFFHSLQYLVFVYRVEKYRTDRQPDYHELRAGVIALSLLFTGWLGFEVIPGALDSLVTNGTKISFFLLASAIFLNLHHVFLDNILWRLGEDEEVRAALLAPR